MGKLLLLGSLGIASMAALGLMGCDKWLAGRNRSRVPEGTLLLVCALGGWPGGLLGIIMFRHKSAKASFQLKLVASMAVWAALAWTGWRCTDLHS